MIPQDVHATAFGFLTSASLIGIALSPVLSGLLGAQSIRAVFVAGAVTLAITWEGEGEVRQPVLLRDGEAAPLAADDQAMEDLIVALASRREELEAEGFDAPQVHVTAPSDVAFDAVVAPILMASYKAGFAVDAVRYDPR